MHGSETWGNTEDKAKNKEQNRKPEKQIPRSTLHCHRTVPTGLIMTVMLAMSVLRSAVQIHPVQNAPANSSPPIYSLTIYCYVHT